MFNKSQLLWRPFSVSHGVLFKLGCTVYQNNFINFKVIINLHTQLWSFSIKYLKKKQTIDVSVDDSIHNARIVLDKEIFNA